MKTVLSFFLLTLFIALPAQALAQAAVDEEVTNTIKEHVQRVIESGSKVAGTSTEVKTFAIIGTLEKSVGSSLQIKSYAGPMRVVELAKDVIFLKANKPIQKEEVELNSPVMILGTLDESETYIGKRVVVSDESIFPTKRKAIWLSFNSSTTRILKARSLGENGGQNMDVPITSATQYVNILGERINKATIQATDPLIVILPETTGATASARKVYSLKLTATPIP
ncbi:hypothetical protein KBD71_01000 [Candidatus Woesebacteria bacterium]|nr:hypothetical protein [Candidatus Woesebacteria bacterium]